MSRIKLSDFSGTDDRARFAAALDYMKEHSGHDFVRGAGGVYDNLQARERCAAERDER